jgi:hypothetical protein
MEFPNFVAGYRGQNLERQLKPSKWIRKAKAKERIVLPLVSRKAVGRAKIKASQKMTAKAKRVIQKVIIRGRGNKKINHLFLLHLLLLRDHLVLPKYELSETAMGFPFPSTMTKATESTCVGGFRPRRMAATNVHGLRPIVISSINQRMKGRMRFSL